MKHFEMRVFCLQLTFSIPSSLVLRLIGAKNYLSLSLFCWSGITIGMAFVKNGHQLIILRFVLVSQKGFIWDIL